MQRRVPNSIPPVAGKLSLSAASDELQVDQPPFHIQAPILPIAPNASLPCDRHSEKVLPFNAYLTDYAREATEIAESPLHLLIDIMAAEKNASLHSNEVFVLQQFLSIYFATDVVTNIVSYYNELAYSCLIPQTYLRKYSLAQIGENVALELFALCSTIAPVTLAGAAGRPSGSQAGGHRQTDTRGEGNRDILGGAGGRDKQNITQNSRDGRGGRGNRGGRGGGGGGSSRSLVVSTRPEGQRFRDVIPTVIHVDVFVTPKKSRYQQSIVRQAAENFLLDPAVMDLQSKAYNPYEEIFLDSENKIRMLFHGTRKSRLHNFKANGVDPGWKPNECCPNRAFYVTNSIEQAMAHVLYVCPRSTHWDVDPIVILVFSVDVTVLHGDRPSPDPSVTFSVKWFQHDNPHHCQDFIESAEYNLGLTKPSLDAFPDHVQIGPICIPGHPQPTILRNWSQQVTYLTQVAACAKPVFDFFSYSLTQILEEKRVQRDVAPAA